MTLKESDHVPYLANVISMAFADSNLSTAESAAIEEIRTRIGATKSSLTIATKAVQQGEFSQTRVGDFSTQVCNIADMLYISCVDGGLDANEKTMLIDFCKKVGLTQEQLNVMVKEAISRADQTKLKFACPECKAELDASAKFCSACGKSIGGVKETVVDSVAFDVPVSGYAIEFCESTSGAFPAALQMAKTSQGFSTQTRNRKTWYLATWTDSGFEEVTKLAELLSGIRNRKAYLAGKEIPWDELFGFVWCVSERSKAYRPAQYCFGKGDGRLNACGCRQAKLDWTEWADWLTYGKFTQSGKGAYWSFDKDRIRHEMMTSLHRYRYCPFLRSKLLETVLKLLPEKIEVMADNGWGLKECYDDSPNAMTVVKKTDYGREETKYDGVRPKGLVALREIVIKALKECGISDISVDEIAK